MADIVLIHGGNHGGWAWREIVTELRAAGHTVFAPSLTGLGDRKHLLSENTTLATHVDDVVNLLYYEDLRDVVLVGHSYAGLVLTVAAEKTDRIGHLVYLDAMVPRHGQTFLDLLTPPLRENNLAAVRPYRTGRGRDFGPGAGMVEHLPKWAGDRLVPHPANDLWDPILLPAAAAEKLPRTYLAAGVNALPDGWEFRPLDMVRQAPWRYIEYDGDHEAPVTHPQVITPLLLEIAAQHGT